MCTLHPTLAGRLHQEWLRWVRHSSRIRTLELHINVWFPNIEGRAQLGEDFEYWRIPLRQTSEKWVWTRELDYTDCWQNEREVFCDHSNVTETSIKARNLSTSYKCSRKVYRGVFTCSWIGVQLTIWSFATFVCITSFTNATAVSLAFTNAVTALFKLFPFIHRHPVIRCHIAQTVDKVPCNETISK